MKEKRYYCDWYSSEESNCVIRKALKKISVIVALVSILIYYNIIMYNYGENLEAYSESAYEYLDEIANNVIGPEGIHEAAIPEDVVEYEITYEDGEIVFNYSLDNNEGKKFATSASMTITLSKDFEVLNKEPNFPSKEKYVEFHKIGVYIFTFMLGLETSLLMAFVSVIAMAVANLISKIHKKKDMKKNLS